jgi:hypothetical protein
VELERERERTESHTNVHLFERTLVVATCLVERKEKWHQIESGKLLIHFVASGIDNREKMFSSFSVFARRTASLAMNEIEKGESQCIHYLYQMTQLLYRNMLCLVLFNSFSASYFCFLSIWWVYLHTSQNGLRKILAH